MNTFTKGPWKVSKSFDNDIGIVVRDSEGEIVANCSVDRQVDPRDFHKKIDEIISNANLIAAAPELLEIAKIILSNKSDGEEGFVEIEWLYINQLIEAIDKAEGGHSCRT